MLTQYDEINEALKSIDSSQIQVKNNYLKLKELLNDHLSTARLKLSEQNISIEYSMTQHLISGLSQSNIDTDLIDKEKSIQYDLDSHYCTDMMNHLTQVCFHVV